MIAAFVSLLMFQSIIINNAISVSAENEFINIKNIDETESVISEEMLHIENIPDNLTTDLKQELSNAVKLDESTYSDLYSICTINNDNTKSLIVFDNPIKYYDSKSDKICFINNSIVKNDDTRKTEFVSQNNNYDVTFSENINDGVLFSYEDYSISMRPISNNNSSKSTLLENEIRYHNVFDNLTDVSYSIENSGIKESIIVSAPNKCYSYSFVLYADGLMPNEEKGQTITFVDKFTGEIVYTIQPIYIIDSYNGDYIEGEEHITYNNYYEIESQDDGSYLIHMNLDKEFLDAESTIYPCVIDPSIWATNFTNDSSSYVLQSGGVGYVNGQLSAGSFNGSGEHLSYVKPNSVDMLKWIEPNRLMSATFNVKAVSTGYSNDCTINLYDSKTNSSASEVTYSQLISSLGTLQSSTTFTALGASYSFDVTSLFRQWISYALGEGGKDPSYGFILRGATNASTPGRWFSSTSSSDTYFYLVYQEGEEIQDGFYNIKNVSTGTYLRYNSGGQLYLSPSPDLDVCKWQAILRKSKDGKTSYGVYALSPYNDLNVSIKGATTGSAVTTNSFGNVFRIIKNADNTFRIMPTNYASVSNAIGISSNHYALIQEYSNIDSMKWTFELIVNKYFSEYSPDNFNDTSSKYPVQYRMNCYGYAFRHILYYKDYSSYGYGYYKQQPGEFCITQYKPESDCIISDDPIENMKMVVHNMQLDASRFGYNIFEYTPTGNSVRQFGSNSRLIAVVTGEDDYHFYMQHNDGSWSHKPGTTAVTNYSINSSANNPVYLTNDNIQSLANQNYYAGGELKFFIITRDAIEDYPHGISNTSMQSKIYYKEIAGSNFFTASKISVTTKQACFDYYNDIDYYVFEPISTKTYTLSTTCESGYNIDGDIYDYNGNLITSITNTGQINRAFNAIGRKRYFIKIYNCDHMPGEYTITIS